MVAFWRNHRIGFGSAPKCHLAFGVILCRFTQGHHQLVKKGWTQKFSGLPQPRIFWRKGYPRTPLTQDKLDKYNFNKLVKHNLTLHARGCVMCG